MTPFRMSKGVIALLSPLSFHGSSILNAAIHNTTIAFNHKAVLIVSLGGKIPELLPEFHFNPQIKHRIVMKLNTWSTWP